LNGIPRFLNPERGTFCLRFRPLEYGPSLLLDQPLVGLCLRQRGFRLFDLLARGSPRVEPLQGIALAP